MNRRVILIAAAASVLIAGIWYMTMWSPASDSLNEAHKRTDSANQQAADLGVKVRALEIARKDLPAKQAQLDRLRAAVPESPLLDEMIATINNSAIGAGVELVGLAPAPPAGLGGGKAPAPKGAGAPTELSLTMSVNGTYFQLSDFMNRLTGAPRLLVLDSVNLAGSSDKSGKMTAAYTAKMFVQPPSPAATAPATTPTTAPAGAKTTGDK